MKQLLVVNDTRPDQHAGCQAAMEGIITLSAKLGLEPYYFHPVGKSWLEDDAFYAAAGRADIVIVNGEGTLHHANERSQALARIGSYCKRTLRIPSVLLNATLFQNDERIYQFLKDFDLISTRDSASKIEAESFGVRDIFVVPDFSFFHNFSDLKPRLVTERLPADKVAIGMADSVFVDAANRLKKMRADRKYINGSLWRNLKVESSIYDYSRKVASMDVFITGRFHGICYAINVGTPFIAIESNTPKISSMLFDIFGQNKRVRTLEDVEKMTPDEIADFAFWTPEEAAVLSGLRARLDASYAELGRRISDLLA